MEKINPILKIAKENNGVVTNEQVVNLGLQRGTLKYLTDVGKLERVARGIYILPEFLEDEFYCIQARFKRGVFSHNTALFLHVLSDRTPNLFCMTFPKSYNATAPRAENIKVFQSTNDLYDLGITEMKSPSGNTVKVYSAEKTLCDILRTSSHTDIQVVSLAFKEYSKLPNKNIPLLSEYAKILKVDEKLRSYLEVLLW